jgi:hypothetical protein
MNGLRRKHRLLHCPPGERTDTGTGLGLAIGRGVGERLGGTLSINGTRPVGTTVTIHVPQPPIDGLDPICLNPAAAQPSAPEPVR